MKHFLVTRFNLRNEKWKTAKDGNEVLTEDWLNHRFHLFEKYCLPSVLNQSSVNFIWCIFFDISTPEFYKKKIEVLTEKHKQIRILYIDGMKNLAESFTIFIRENLTTIDKFIITTRLDNDDLIHSNFISTIQYLAKPQNSLVIDIRSGYQVSIKDGICETRKSHSVFNPFISLIESTSDFSTVMSKMHVGWEKSESVLVFDKEPLWIEFIHDKNKVNSVEKKSPLIWKSSFDEFGFKLGIKNHSYIYITVNNTLLAIQSFFFFCKKTVKHIIMKLK